MWGWSERIAEHARAASIGSWQTHQVQPTILDPEEWAEEPAEDEMSRYGLAA
ncbi:hypothetical protein ACFVMC_14590 [Nocardia sp. NPDC127579]|uniref:hypothetical protein n=1 Tax=Nocardia sp. NPDC127579 TaxID=3345402 RepID=UPI003635C6D7